MSRPMKSLNIQRSFQYQKRVFYSFKVKEVIEYLIMVIVFKMCILWILVSLYRYPDAPCFLFLLQGAQNDNISAIHFVVRIKFNLKEPAEKSISHQPSLRLLNINGSFVLCLAIVRVNLYDWHPLNYCRYLSQFLWKVSKLGVRICQFHFNVTFTISFLSLVFFFSIPTFQAAEKKRVKVAFKKKIRSVNWRHKKMDKESSS